MYNLFTVLILITTAFTFINHRFIKWPATIAVTVFSLVISMIVLALESRFPTIKTGFANHLKQLNFKELVMNMVLGFLLFGAAFKTDVKLFKQQIKPIVGMALISTILSTFLIGLMMFYLFQLFHMDITLIDCFLFGALISPTDPIAALGVLKRVGIEKKLELQITGESLINDGVAIVLFTIFLNLDTTMSGGQIVGSAVLLFVKQAGGAIVFGVIIGWLALQLLKLTDNYKVEIMITLSVVMGGYSLGELLHVSAAIAMVVAGLMCSTEGKKEKWYISNDDVFTFWELIEDLMNVILFLLIGLEVFVIAINGIIFLIGFIAICVVLIARYFSVLPVYIVFKRNFGRNSLKLLTWAGLRGAVCIALALSLPESSPRSEFLALTYIIAVFSIVVQGLTIRKVSAN